MKSILVVLLASSLPFTASATFIDLSNWVENGFKGDNEAGTWELLGVNNESVYQTINGQPTVYFEPGTQASYFEGTIRIANFGVGDNDFVGFVLGYQDGELNSTDADFWLLDWKRSNDTSAGNTATRGLALSHVRGDIANGSDPNPPFWIHTDYVTEVQRGLVRGDSGWGINFPYNFKITFTENLIEVYVRDELEISYAGDFTSGAIGFYNYSQKGVTYTGIESVVVPTPAALPLFLAGLGVLLRFGRKRAR